MEKKSEKSKNKGLRRNWMQIHADNCKDYV